MKTFTRCARLLMVSALIGISTCALHANSADFNNDGKADLLYVNKTTGKLTVWFMNGSTQTSTKPITLNGSPIAASPGWKVVGVGKFGPSPNFPNNNAQLSILWQDTNPASRVMAVWYLKADAGGVDQTALDTTALLPTASPYYEARAVGDFDGNGKSDIAFQSDIDGTGAVWLMNGLQIAPNGIGTYPNTINWRITGAGDFGTLTGGAKDCRDDILVTSYNPATDSAYELLNNFAMIWFMSGTTRTATSTINNSAGQSVLLESPDWRFVASGNYDNDTTPANCTAPAGRNDILLRDAVNGRQGVWHLNGKTLLTGTFIKPEPDPAWKLYSQDWLQSTWRHKDIYPTISASTTVNGSSATVTVNYRIKPAGGNGIQVKRRIAGNTTWTTLTSGVTETTTTDPNLTPGIRYEYQVQRQNNADEPYSARIYACANQPASVVSDRGRLVLVIENSVFSGIATGLKVFTNDLIGDGWSVVIKPNAPRHLYSIGSHPECAGHSCNDSGITKYILGGSDYATDILNKNNRDSVQSLITDSANGTVKGVILIGHVTIPMSGINTIDGHCNHRGAWVADAWYGHSGSGWTDSSNNAELCVWDQAPWNYNIPGDGKFDDDFIPATTAFTKFVGRIDFARLPEFSTGNNYDPDEATLLNAYFAKNHSYRINNLKFENKVATYSTHSHIVKLDSLNQLQPGQIRYYDDGPGFLRALRLLSPLVGSNNDRFVVGHAFHQKTDNFLCGFLAGNGSPFYICENQPGSGVPEETTYLEYTTNELKNDPEPKIAFYHLFGSYFGDWYFSDDFMRSALAKPNSGLAAVWAYAAWDFHGLGLGDPLGSLMIQSVRDNTRAAGASRAISILGDPTLRSTILPPPTSLSHNGSQLSWTAPDATQWQYYVYSAPTMNGTFTLVANMPTSNTYLQIPNSGVLMVRAAKTIVTGSGAFQNMSQGAFFPNPY